MVDLESLAVQPFQVRKAYLVFLRWLGNKHLLKQMTQTNISRLSKEFYVNIYLFHSRLTETIRII